MFSKINLTVKFVFIFLFFSSLNAQNLSEEEFLEILEEVAQQVSRPAYIEPQIPDFKGVAYINRTGANLYEIGLQGFEAGDTYGRSEVGVTTFTKNAVIMNHGDHCTYKFVSEEIPRVLHDKIMNYDEIKESEQSVYNLSPDAEVKMDVIDNEYTLTASYKYSNNRDEIYDNLWPILTWSRNSITLIWKAKKELYREYRDELLDNKMKPLTNDEVIFLLEDYSLYDVYIEDDNALGAWEFEISNVNYEAYNYPDEFEISYYRFTSEDLSPDLKTKIFDKMNVFVKDNKFDGASSTELVWDADNPGFLNVIIKFKYDETVEGNDFFDGYYEICKNSGFEFAEKLDSVLEELGIK